MHGERLPRAVNQSLAFISLTTTASRRANPQPFRRPLRRDAPRDRGRETADAARLSFLQVELRADFANLVFDTAAAFRAF